MSGGDIRAGIAGGVEFGDNDIGATPLLITTNGKLKFGAKIGVNTGCKGGPLMLLTTKCHYPR